MFSVLVGIRFRFLLLNFIENIQGNWFILLKIIEWFAVRFHTLTVSREGADTKVNMSG